MTAVPARALLCHCNKYTEPNLLRPSSPPALRVPTDRWAVSPQDYALEKLPSVVAQFGPSVVSDLMDKAKSLFPRLDIEGKILLANSIGDIASKARRAPACLACWLRKAHSATTLFRLQGLVPATICENNLLPIVLSVFQSPEDDIHEARAIPAACR